MRLDSARMSQSTLSSLSILSPGQTMRLDSYPRMSPYGCIAAKFYYMVEEHRQPGNKPRPVWRSVAVPAEHGGWGLTAEAVLLGLLIRPSIAGVAIGLAAILAFLTRTPLKLAMVDRRRHRRLERSVLAERVAGIELALLIVMISVAALYGQEDWWILLIGAIPFFVIELSFDIRSRGRRLIPELSGALGMGAVATSIAISGNEPIHVSIGLWIILGARAIASVPFARTQVRRMKNQPDSRLVADILQPVAVIVAITGWALNWTPWLGVLAILLLGLWNLVEMRRPVHSAKQVGLLQSAAGLIVVIMTAIGVHIM